MQRGFMGDRLNILQVLLPSAIDGRAKPRTAIAILVISILASAILVPAIAIARPQASRPTVERRLSELTQNSDLVLGVVRSPDNEAQWPEIDRRIRQAGLVYRPIALDRLRQEVENSGVNLLLLPNLSTWSGEQVLELEALMSSGIRAIVTGRLGENSSPGVRQALRSLVGAYWERSLPQPGTMQRIACRTEALCPAKWIPANTSDATLPGGILTATDFNAQAMATWIGTDAAPAVTISDRAIVFGWQWGTTPNAEFDTAWLRAALVQMQASSPPSSQNNPPPPPTATPPPPTVAPPPTPTAPPPAPPPASPRRERTLPYFPENSTSGAR
ncbi:MAG: hypothetical protein D6680_06270 [Cyanobacteria bacterium J007]|nr:MAG: hypothetical protein D6680_06270 [Cyanobacteria bacterium J007]